MSKISVIVPVFNLEKYLSECLDCLLAQTFTDFEVIAVDDGSTDNSGKILDDYAERDTRIKPVHIKNGGVSNARNTGLDMASGEFIYFLDGDDTIEPHTFELLYNNSNGFDLVQAAFDNVYSDSTVSFNRFVDKELEGDNIILGAYFLAQIKESCWNKLYRKSLIGDLRFDTTLKVAEDSIFVHTYIKRAKKVKLMTNITYHYRIHNESCIHSQMKEIHFFPLKLRDDFLSECEGDKVLYKKWVRFEVDLCFYLLGLILTNNSTDFFCKLKDLRNRVITKKRYILFAPYYSVRFKIGVIILWLCPKLFYKIYRRKKI